MPERGMDVGGRRAARGCDHRDAPRRMTGDGMTGANDGKTVANEWFYYKKLQWNSSRWCDILFITRDLPKFTINGDAV